MSKMGFGFLQLPEIGEGIDYAPLNRMTDAFLAAGGVNSRSSFQIADKLPDRKVTFHQDVMYI